AAPAVHLGPAGNADFQEVARVVIADGLHESLYQERAFRPRANNAHVAPKNIEKLRQLVDANAPKDLAKSSAPGVALYGPLRVAGRYRSYVHGSEFVHPEYLAVQTDALLRDNHWPGRSEPHSQSNEGKHGSGQQ